MVIQLLQAISKLIEIIKKKLETEETNISNVNNSSMMLVFPCCLNVCLKVRFFFVDIRI